MLTFAHAQQVDVNGYCQLMVDKTKQSVVGLYGIG